MKYSSLNVSSLLAAPLAILGVISANSLPAQAQFVESSGTITSNGQVNFFSGQPGGTFPTAFWFPDSTTCSLLGTGCDFNVETVSGLFGYIDIPAQSADSGFQYLFKNRNDQTPNAGGILPSVCFAGNAFVTPNSGDCQDDLGFAADFIASTTPVAPSDTEFLAFTAIPNVADYPEYGNVIPEWPGTNGVPLVQYATDDPLDPVITVYGLEATSFTVDGDEASQTAQTDIAITAKAVAEFANGERQVLFGGQSFGANFSFSDTNSAFNITTNLEIKEQVPEPTGILGALMAIGGAFFLKKKKSTKLV